MEMSGEPRVKANAGVGRTRGVQPFGTPKPLSDGQFKTSLVQRVYEAIMSSMDSGELDPGSRIVASDIAQRLGLSRAPVREALAVLAGQGLVELHPDRGASLRPMNMHDLAQIYEVVAPVAAIGLRAAAKRIHENDNAARIEAAMGAIRLAAKAKPLGLGFYLALNDFHYIANAIGHRPYVDTVLRSVNIEYWNRLLAAAIDLETHAATYVRTYQRLTDALLAGDLESTEAIMHYHADWCIALLEPAYETAHRRQ
jgi:DNA-binding GntR family transcriptional regulator